LFLLFYFSSQSQQISAYFRPISAARKAICLCLSRIFGRLKQHIQCINTLFSIYFYAAYAALLAEYHYLMSMQQPSAASHAHHG
jgi:hypothetical protein